MNPAGSRGRFSCCIAVQNLVLGSSSPCEPAGFTHLCLTSGVVVWAWLGETREFASVS